jgi:hypothetical protein
MAGLPKGGIGQGKGKEGACYLFKAMTLLTPWVLLLQVIGLAAGEPDFDTPAPIVEAGYPHSPSSPRT